MSYFASDDNVAVLQRKVPLLMGIATLFVFIVISRLFFLQIYKGDAYRQISEQISVREVSIPARRGLILDRNGHVLADNRTYYEITVIPQLLQNQSRVIDSLIKLIGMTREEIQARLTKFKSQLPFMPVVLVDNAPYDMISKIREFGRPDYPENSTYFLEGVEVRTSPLRVFNEPEVFSHALGYLNEINPEQLEKFNKANTGRYESGDLIGASGLERAYDFEIRGEDGIKARVVDARGKEIKNETEDLALLAERASLKPVDGNHLVSTLDYESQMAAHQAFTGRRGAAVALDPNTGEVLVLYSWPGYDTNRITKNVDKPYWQFLNTDKDKYLYNRAIQAAYPPGSTYKIVTALAGLETKKIDEDSHFTCGGGLHFGNRFFQCWNKAGHGSTEVRRAIMQSCDVFFYNVGLKVGVDNLWKYAHVLGLGEKTGIEIPYEQPGLIPSSEWKLKRYKEPWIESETLSIAIGQGYDLVTPLQSARMIAMIANGGRMITPHLAKSILDGNRQKIKDIDIPLGAPQISEEILKPIRDGLIGVVQGQGTAGRLKASPFKIAGKTGTAQVVGYESKVAKGERTNDHAWFVAYAPYDDPKIAVAVVVENGGHGGAAAAPVAQAIIDTYLSKTAEQK